MGQPDYVIWTVYDHPSDFPDCFVARQWRYDTNPPTPTENLLIAASLQGIRNRLTDAGLVRMAPIEGDDPVIVETWI